MTKPYNKPDNKAHLQKNVDHVIIQVAEHYPDETSADDNPAVKAENDGSAESNNLIAEKGYVNNFL